MKYALQLYGQLRTFQESLPSLLKFIDYYNKDYDVFLLIDKHNTKNYIVNSNPNYSDENMQRLLEILIKDRIKSIMYIDSMTTNDILTEEQIKVNYNMLWSKFNTKYGNITRNDFVCSLKYRTYLLNNLRLDYEKLSGTVYNYVVRSRFDYGALDINKAYDINEKNTPILFSDCLTIASADFINTESKLGLIYPFTPKCLYDEDCNLLVEKYKKYENWRGDKFIDKNWIFMPELNQRLFLLEQGFTFIEAWWETPCNYGFKIIR